MTIWTSEEGFLFCKYAVWFKEQPGTLKMTIDATLASVKWKCAMFYPVGIVIFSKRLVTCISHVEQLLKQLQDLIVAFKLKKSSFLMDTADYLGLIIRRRRLKIAAHTTDAIQNIKRPCNTTKLRFFLELCNVFRRNGPSFDRIAAPLDHKFQKDHPKLFGPLIKEEHAVMNTLQKKLVSFLILALLYAGGHFLLDTEACNAQVQQHIIARPAQLNEKSNWLPVELIDKRKASFRYHSGLLRSYRLVYTSSTIVPQWYLVYNSDWPRLLRWILNSADATGVLAL